MRAWTHFVGSARSAAHALFVGCLLVATLTAVDARAAQAPVDLADWFAVQPGTTWRYLQSNGRETKTVMLPKTKTVRGRETFVLTNSADHSRQYFAFDDDGLRLAKLTAKGLRIPGLGRRNVAITFDPPMLLCARSLDLGQDPRPQFLSSGKVEAAVAGFRRLHAPYDATFEAFQGGLVQVPAFVDAFESLVVAGDAFIGDESIPFDLTLAPGIGVALSTAAGRTAELTSTDLGRHALTIDSVRAGKALVIQSARPLRTATIRVKLGNRGGRTEVIEDQAMLDALLTVSIESLGACAAPAAPRFAPERFPIVIQSGARHTFRVRTDIDCANDPARTRSRDPGHDDYRVTVTLAPAALDRFTPSDLTPPPATPVESEALIDVVQK